MIRFFMLSAFFAVSAVVFGLASPNAHADARAVYTITDIAVDERAGSVIEARQKAMATARLIGARQLIRKLTLEEHRSAAGGVPVDRALAEQFAAAVDVQDETAGAGRYRGTLSVVFNPRTVRAHLDSLGVPYVDTQGPLGLFIPLASGGSLDAWRESLGDGDKYGLSPYVTAPGAGYTRDTTWDELKSEADYYRARRGIMGELIGRSGAYQIKLSTLTADGRQTIGTTRPKATLSEANAAASAYLGQVWKARSVIVDTTRTLQNATVLYTSLAEWNTLRGALARSPLVADFKIGAIARDGAMVTFAYAGDQARLQNDLRQRGVSYSREGAHYVMRSAVSGGRGN
jgi:hypothetical protein